MAAILVADDHPLNRHFLTTLLSYYGHDVREAADGVEALAAARRQRPDAIIADVVMPRMDGPALVSALRSDPVLADVPVIFYTASYREEESRAIAAAAGVKYMITKPAEPETVLEMVHRALGDTSAASEDERRVSADRAREYVRRLQVSGIRLGALMELTQQLGAEHDPDALLLAACHGMRTVFGADYALIAIAGEGQTIAAYATDGDVDAGRRDELLARLAAYEGTGSRVSGSDGALLSLARTAMPEVQSALLLPLTTRGRHYGWTLLGRRGGSPFTVDDERMALAAVTQIRAEHESLRAERVERHRMEGELRLARENLAALVEASPVAIVGFDRDFIVRSWNPAAERTFGWTAAETIGGRLSTLPPEAVADFERSARACLTGGTVTGSEQRRVRKDGAVIDVSVSMAPLRDETGMVRGFVSIVDDVTDLRASRELLRALSARILSIQEEERSRLARELHDDVGQLLTAIKIDAARLMQEIARGAPPPPRLLEGLLPLIDATMDAVVRIVSELRPSRIGEMGLAAAIEKKLADFRQRTDIVCSFEIGAGDLEFRDEKATAIFRILEEALTNVARHSGAQRATVSLRRERGDLVLEVRDQGRGIHESERLSAAAHGLIGMKERAVILGGTVEVIGVEGGGTAVIARIPLEKDSGLHR